MINNVLFCNEIVFHIADRLNRTKKLINKKKNSDLFSYKTPVKAYYDKHMKNDSWKKGRYLSFLTNK